MQQPLSSYQPQSYTNPVSLNCIVNNKALKAEIIEEKDNPINYTFVIKFSDGTVAEATVTESGKWLVDDFKKIPYVRAIENNLQDFISVKNYEWDKFEIKYGTKDLLVWVSKINNEEGLHYSIHYNGQYRFDLRKVKDNWEAKSKSVRNPQIDEKLASYISMTIDAHA